MQLVNNYAMHPGQCHFCGSSRTPVIDSLRDIDRHGWDGRLYICYECAVHIGQLVGSVPADKYSEIVELAATLKKELSAAERRLAKFKGLEADLKELVK